MRILFILGKYHPDYSANGLCARNVIDALVADGHDVTCVVNSFAEFNEPYELNGAKIYPIKPRLSVRLAEWCRRNQNRKICGLLNRLSALMTKAKLGLTQHRWPFVSRGYSRRFYREALRLHRENSFDVVVGVYTPFEALYAAYRLKKKDESIKFVPYYLDALAGGWGLSLWSENKISKRTRKWEGLIDSCADAVVSMNATHKYFEDNPLSLSRDVKRYFLDVPALLPSISCEEARISEERKYAFYAGYISYPGRNPLPFLDAFSKILDLINIDLVFVGSCNHMDVLEPYIKSSNGRIKHLGLMDHGSVLEMEKNAEYLVNIGNENPNLIPSKIFEYMRFGKPIISTYRTDNDTSLEPLKKYGNACFIDERLPAEDNARTLLDFINSENKKPISPEEMQKEFYLNTPTAFVDVINSLKEK